MKLGNFSVSLAVKDLQASMAFYQKLGFASRNGDLKKWAVMQNGPVIIGLFQGILDKNTLTFNPGWDNMAQTLPSFTDVRVLDKQVRADGIEPSVSSCAEKDAGPAYFIIADPDGNPILVDQHV